MENVAATRGGRGSTPVPCHTLEADKGTGQSEASDWKKNNTRMFRMKNFQVAGGERGKEKEGLGSAVDGRMHNATSGWQRHNNNAYTGKGAYSTDGFGDQG
eukprot:EG_transcript_55318